MVNTHPNEPDIKQEQVQVRPDLTQDLREHRQQEARFGMSVPLMIALVGAIFLIVIIAAVIATR